MSFLCLDFVNSSWYITHQPFADPLRDSGWLIKLADKWSIGHMTAPTEGELARLFEMRSQLSQLLDKTAQGHKLDQADIALINGYMREASFCRQLIEQNADLRLKDMPQADGWKWFMAETASSFARLYTSEAANSLKICQNPECRWFFIDQSKSRARKWCDDTCASLMKVRRFRQKQKVREAKEP